MRTLSTTDWRYRLAFWGHDGPFPETISCWDLAGKIFLSLLTMFILGGTCVAMIIAMLYYWWPYVLTAMAGAALLGLFEGLFQCFGIDKKVFWKRLCPTYRITSE